MTPHRVFTGAYVGADKEQRPGHYRFRPEDLGTVIGLDSSFVPSARYGYFTTIAHTSKVISVERKIGGPEP